MKYEYVLIFMNCSGDFADTIEINMRIGKIEIGIRNTRECLLKQHPSDAPDHDDFRVIPIYLFCKKMKSLSDNIAVQPDIGRKKYKNRFAVFFKNIHCFDIFSSFSPKNSNEFLLVCNSHFLINARKSEMKRAVFEN